MADIEPYVALFNSLVSVAVFGLILNLIKAHRETTQERINTIKDRLDGSKEDLERTERWHKKEKEAIEKEKAKKEEELLELKVQLNNVLTKEGINFESLALGQTLKRSTNEVRELIEELSTHIEARLKELETNVIPKAEIISESQLVLAKAKMANGDFEAASQTFNDYLPFETTDWEAYFSKAVSLANLRKGWKSNLASVRAYNDTIALLPKDIDANTRARIFGYRAAILKRLNRLEEAESDLIIALRHASKKEDLSDIHYNIACIHAMRGERGPMIDHIYKIKDKSYLNLIENHLSDYFKKYANDMDLLQILKSKKAMY